MTATAKCGRNYHAMGAFNQGINAMGAFNYKGPGYLVASFPVSPVFHAVLISDEDGFVVGSMVSGHEAIASPEYFSDLSEAKAYFVWSLVEEGIPIASIDAHPKALFLAKKAVGILEKLEAAGV